MALLAFNTTLPQAMRLKYQLAMAVLPLGLMFASFGPLFLLASWIAAEVGIAPDLALRGQPHGAAWIGLFLASMVVFMLVGYALGWVLNAMISRSLLGWPLEKVRAVYLRSEVPAHWIKGNVTVVDAAEQSVDKWDEQRKVGLVRFVVTRGVLAWGCPMLLGMYVLPRLLKDQAFTPIEVLIHLLLWTAGGAAFGLAVWFMSEAGYRKRKAERH